MKTSSHLLSVAWPEVKTALEGKRKALIIREYKAS